MKIQYYIPISINDTDLTEYDPSSEFYNDECNKASEGGVDMTLYDKKNRFNTNNMSLCEKGCTYNGLELGAKMVKCECYIKSDMTFNSEEINSGDLLNQMDSQKSNSNLKVVQCINNLLEPGKIKSNCGFFLLLLILIIFIIIFIMFCARGKRNLENKIDEIIYKKFIKEKENNIQIKINNDNNNNILTTKIQKNYNNNKKKSIKKKNDKNKLRVSKDNSKKTIKENKNINKLSNKIDTFNTKGKILTNIQNIGIKLDDKPDNDIDYELNTLKYSLAIKYDKRTCCDYYCSLIKNKQLFLFTFCSFNDYNSGIIKKFIFFLSFAIHYTISALFFNDDNMHQIYEDEGSYNISYQLPKILISALVSTVFLRLMLEILILTDRNVLQVKRQETQQQAELIKKEVIKCINIKFTIFFILNFILLILFWFYLTCFNGVYENTQIYLIENTCIGFGISLIYPLFWNILPTTLRMCSLSGTKPDNKCIYSISKYLQII